MTSPLFSSANKLKLGTFSANCSGGMAVTKVEERWDNNWDNNIDLVQQCDALHRIASLSLLSSVNIEKWCQLTENVFGENKNSVPH